MIQETQKDKVNLGYIFAVISAVSSAMLGIIARYAYSSGLDTFTVIVGRAIFAALFMGIYVAVTNKNAIKIELTDIPKFILIGCFGIALNFICFLSAVKYTTVTTVVVLVYTHPFMVNIASHLLFKEKLRAKTIAALILTLVGCFLAVGAYSPATIDLNLLGILFGFGSGCCTAFYTIYSKFLLRNYSSNTISLWGFVFAAAALILINPIGVKQVVIASYYSKILLIVLALIPTVLAYSTLTTSINIIGPSKTAIVKTLEPVIAAILSLVILGEKLTLLQWIGILLVIFGVGLIYSREKTI